MIPVIALLLWFSVASTDVDLTTPPQDVLDHYYQDYPYMKYRGRLWSFESEFTWPEGYRRLDSTSLTPFQYWVSHMPLWHYQIGVTAASRVLILNSDQISRAVHLPWRVSKLNDYTVPWQVLAEYLAAHDLLDKWRVLPRGGDTISYQKFLSSEAVYDARRNVKFRAAEPRFPDTLEFRKFLSLIALNTTYGSLAANTDSISENSLRPGDLLLARNDPGTKGRVYMVMVVAENDAGEKRYIVATTCPNEGCDFHIPLFRDDRTNPWLTLDEMKALAPDSLPYTGFFRLRVPE